MIEEVGAGPFGALRSQGYIATVTDGARTEASEVTSVTEIGLDPGTVESAKSRTHLGAGFEMQRSQRLTGGKANGCSA